MKIATVIGARPQFIKAAVVSRAINDYSDIEEVVIHTGQHYDANMSEVFFEEMNIPHPDYNLNISGLSHGAMTGRMMEKIEGVLLKEKPDCVLVYGDTNSTLAGALTAGKMGLPVAHVEAGLRSYNKHMPEEINRVVTDRISDILFCPTAGAVENLKKEGIDGHGSKVFNTGDVMYDAALFYSSGAVAPKQPVPSPFILATVHRAGNTDNAEALLGIFSALNTIAETTPVVLPLHPRTKAKLETLKFDFNKSKISFMSPVGYLEMVWLLKHCKFVMTDSGGLQKESYFFKKRCVVLRDETEWIELVDSKVNLLAGNEYSKILACSNIMADSPAGCFETTFYGEGIAGKGIVDILVSEIQSV